MSSSVLHRDLNCAPPLAVRGAGSYIYDAGGRAYLDASGGAAVSCLGHGRSDIADAVSEQLRRLEFAHTSFFTNEPTEKLAATLIDRAPSGFGRGRVAFVSSGSEAVEAALKLARQFHVENGEPQRTRFVARNGSYHGNTLGALAVGGHRGRRALYQPLLMDASFVSPCYAYRHRHDGESDSAFARRLAAELDAHLIALGPDTVAAFIAEPIVGATLGSVPAVADYFALIRAVCDSHGVLLIADEVMCGMGRAGDWFAIGHDGVAPDIITIAKGLAAGYQPIGATLASERVVAVLAGGSGVLAHGHTYMSHAVACAAALAVIDVIDREKLLESVREGGHRLAADLAARFGDHPHVGDIRGRGYFWSLELVADRQTKRPFPASLGLAARIRRAALAEGLVCYPSSGTADGLAGDHVLLAPPFTASAAELDEMLDRLAAAFHREFGHTAVLAA